jgi:hypothetical protein
MTKREFIEKAREVHGYKYSYPNLSDKILSNDIIDINYKGVLYKQKVVKHILLRRCPEKNTPTKTTEQFIEEAQEVWGDKYDYSLVEYRGALKKVKIIYEGVIFEQVATSHLRYAPELNMNSDWFIKKATDKWGDKYDYSLVEYTNCNEKVKILYKKTGEVFEQSPHNHLFYAPENIILSTRKTTEQFIKESNLVHDFKYTYEKTKYIKNQIKVTITCRLHGDFEQKPLAHIQGGGCPACSESKGEKIIRKILDNYKISYSSQHTFSDCKNKRKLPFDFYIPSIRTIIEFDGLQHFQPIEHFGGLETYNILKQNDKIKSDYCEENFINLIRIKYDDDIHQMLHENLKNLIKLKVNSL